MISRTKYITEGAGAAGSGERRDGTDGKKGKDAGDRRCADQRGAVDGARGALAASARSKAPSILRQALYRVRST
jgi:hypothetical protein